MKNGEGRRADFILILMALVLIAGGARAAPGQDSLTIQHTPLVTFKHGEVLTIRAQLSGEAGWVRFFYRAKGVSQFQVRNLEKSKEGAYSLEFDTTELPELEFQYYIEASQGEKIVVYPPQAPDAPLTVRGTSDRPLPKIPDVTVTAKERQAPVPLPFEISATGEKIVKQKEEPVTPQVTSVAGSVRLFFNYERSGLGIQFDSTFPFTNRPPQGEPEIDLANMQVAVTKNRHTVRIGDLNFRESEFSIAAFGRRGVEYLFEGARFRVHAFDVSTQQLTGFKGIGIPRAAISLLGASLEVQPIKNVYTVKAVFVTGQDDPSLAGNNGYSFIVQRREGTVLAIAQSLRLWENRINLGAEFASSKISRPDLDEESREGTAWSVNGNFNWGPLRAGGLFTRVSKDFNPIGYAFFANDRDTGNASLGLSFGRFSLTGAYVFGQTNVPGFIDTSMMRNDNKTLTMNWGLSDTVSLNALYNNGIQKVTGAWDPTATLDLKTQEIGGGFNIFAGTASSFTLTGSASERNNRVYTAATSKNLSLTLGASLRAGEWVLFQPTISGTYVHFTEAGKKTLDVNSSLLLNIQFVPRAFSVALTGYYARSEFWPGKPFDTLGGTADANLYLKRLIKVAQIVFTLSGRYTQTGLLKDVHSFWDVRAKASLSF